MSPKASTSRASAKARFADSFAKHGESDNVCSLNRTDSDSESEADSVSGGGTREPLHSTPTSTDSEIFQSSLDRLDLDLLVPRLIITIDPRLLRESSQPLEHADSVFQPVQAPQGSLTVTFGIRDRAIERVSHTAERRRRPIGSQGKQVVGEGA